MAGGADMISVGQMMQRGQEFRRSGAATTVLLAPGSIDGPRCDALAELPAIDMAGAKRDSTRKLNPIVLPSAPLPVDAVTPGFIDVVGGTVDGIGVLLGPEAKETLGAESTFIQTAAGAVRIGGSFTYPDDGRRPGLAYAAIAPTVDGDPFDECWVTSWPQSDVRSALLTSILVSLPMEDPPEITQLNTTRGAAFDGHELFAGRPSRFAAALATLGGAAIGFIGLRIRRLSLAAALHAGLSRNSLSAIVTVETVIWGAPFAFVTASLTILIARGVGEGNSEVVMVGLAACGPTWVGGLAGAMIGVATIQEKHLFRYFTAR
ncbi:hypothetical protein KXS11_07740 [Plantibacter flavus]|uniref:hypothetical protein n=1 Tax=Plantibacter flavus TaxID=150123 RepID=UPI003F1794FF